ncbi:MAG: putative glycolipid-binding domain-containing protein [Dongiaceae bacterium]
MNARAKQTLRRLVWRRIMDDQSFEICTVTSVPDGFGISGHIIAVQDSEPLTVAYDIRCGRDWSARDIAIGQVLGNARRDLRLARAGAGWLVDGAPDPRLDGCAEPDLGYTPATNALAIRRLDLEIGQAAEITCAWVKFPDLQIEPSLQRYERLGEHEYRYTNVASGFTAIVTVDALALPVTYERIWTRIADWQGE